MGSKPNRKKTYGTREWATKTVNCCTGCSNDCQYCYAKGIAVRFKRLDANQWRHETVQEHEMDVHLTDSLKTELSGIFNWALEGFKRLRDREFRFEESSSMKQSKQSYRDQSNSALSFAGECLEKSSPDESLRFKEVYEAYELYCEKEGFRSRMKKSRFRKELEKTGCVIENSSKHNNELRIFAVRLS